MDWSAALSLRTAKTKQYVANYGSFQTTTMLASSAASASSASYKSRSQCSIRIPESIPEHACVVQFTSPRTQALAKQVAQLYYAHATTQSLREQPVAIENETCVKHGQPVTHEEEDPVDVADEGGPADAGQDHGKLHHGDRFRSIVSPAAREAWRSVESKGKHNSAAIYSVNALATPVADSSTASNYWMQKREKQRAKQERRRQRAVMGLASAQPKAVPNERSRLASGANGQAQYGACASISKKKATTTTAEATDEPRAPWKTALIFCSMPLVLVLVFLIILLCQAPAGATWSTSLLWRSSVGATDASPAPTTEAAWTPSSWIHPRARLRR